jgi:regulator of sirC expression with transglutaminase-like and TPR domain
MDVEARWRKLIALPEHELPLDHAALLISAHANPDLDVDAQLERLVDLAGRLHEPSTAAACDLLFGTLGLQGDRVTYGDPSNSYLDRVLDRRLGIPISLSVLLIEVGRRSGVPLEGVGMPGHFLVRDRTEPDVLIDPFSGGRRVDHAACEALLQAVAGPTAQLTPAMLAPTGSRAVVNRMLANLDRSFRDRQDHRSLTWVTRLRLSVPGIGLGNRADLAAQLADLGYPGEAADAYDEMAQWPGLDPNIAERLHTRSIVARATLN